LENHPQTNAKLAKLPNTTTLKKTTLNSQHTLLKQASTATLKTLAIRNEHTTLRKQTITIVLKNQPTTNTNLT